MENPLFDNRLKQLSKIPSPTHLNGLSVLNDLNKAQKEGTLHILYNDYSILYGSNKELSNINIPHISPSPKNKQIIRDLIIINNPDDAERLVRKHIKKQPNLKPFLGNSIISNTDINAWKQQRNHYISAFDLTTLHSIIPITDKRALHGIHTLTALSNNGTTAVNINDYFLNETLGQLQLAMFGFSPEFIETTQSNVRSMFSGKNIPYTKEFIPKFFNELGKSNGSLSQTMKDRFMDLGNKRNSEMVGNSLIFSFAGHDTTAHTLSWLIYELSKNKIIQNKLYVEINHFWKTQENRTIEYSDLKRLPYMTRCIMETLRLWPAIPNGTFRELIEDDYIIDKYGNNIILPKGTYIQIPNWGRHRSDMLWGNDVLQFNPDREFIGDELWNNTVMNSYNPSSKRFSPFTYGPRDCIGKNFSQIEMRLILLHLIKNFEFSLTDKQNIHYTPENIGFNSFTFGPRNIENDNLSDSTLGLWVNVKLRPTQSKL